MITDMPTYKYVGVKASAKVSGTLAAENESHLRGLLREQGILLISAKQIKISGKDTLKVRAKWERHISNFFIKQTEIEQAMLQLVILLKGDIAIVEAFEQAARLAKGYMASALFEVALSVKQGSSLSKAIRLALPQLGELYQGLIGVGEVNGSLPQMFAYCVRLMQQKRKMRNSMIRAMTYPAIVVLLGAGVGYYVSTVSIPQIASVMGGESDKLPPVTRALLDTSDWIADKGYMLIIYPCLVTIILLVIRLFKPCALVMDHLFLWIPIIGKALCFAENALFNKTMGILIRSGISVVESLDLIEATLTNAFYKTQIDGIRRAVRAGKMFSDGLAQSALQRLSPLTPALVQVGESSGNMDEGLHYVGEYYEDALERRLDLMAKLIEPTLVVVVGGMVAFVYVAFFMGMAAMNTATL